MNQPHTEPRNASELHYLATATEMGPTLDHRTKILADFHAKGLTLPDTTASDASRAAWSARAALASKAKAPARVAAPAPAAVAVPKPAPFASENPAPAAKAPAKAPESKQSYADRLRASLNSPALTDKAREEIKAELARLPRG